LLLTLNDEDADAAASSTVFVELMLEVIEAALVQNSEAFSLATDQVSD
jgi:hypothetical protein